MPSVFTHSVIGFATGKSLEIKNLPARFWILSIICPILPDADIIGFRFGIPYGHFFGHRGFFHSIFFSLLLSLFMVFVFFRREKVFSKKWFFFVCYFLFITGSHGILDAFTSGGLGVALFSPFDTTRYFFNSTPILVSPIGIEAFFSEWGLRVILSEMLWVWLPLFFLLFLFNRIFVKYNGFIHHEKN